MKLSDKAKNLTGVLTIEIQGFFTERFINLCKINNIKIWDIKNIVSGVVRFNIHISNFKKLRKIAKKTKCKIKVKEKKGIYFKLFKYRKRKVLAFLIIILLLMFSLSTCFIWNIKISGNDRISTDIIKEKLKESGIYIGRFKIGMNKVDILKKVRSTLPEITWVGLEIRGTDAEIKVVEKVILNDNDKQDNRIGDIISNCDGVITRIIAENGTALIKEGSYVQKGTVLIEGKIYSEILGEELVHGKGIIRANKEYIFEEEYKFVKKIKEYKDKSKYSIGFSFNSNEIFINYLNKSKKYDKLKSSKTICFLGNELSLDWYVFNEYTEKEITITKEDILSDSSKEAAIFIDDIMQNIKDFNLVKETEKVEEKSNSIIYKKIFTINEPIGEFVERIQ